MVEGRTMIDGLKLTFSGDELRRLLETQIQRHQQSADWWAGARTRTPEDQSDEAPLLPEHMCGNEAERYAWRAEVLAFIRDHLEAAETYRLGSADLEFGELLPEKPGWLQQDEYEEKTRVGFTLERLTKSLDGGARMTYGLCRDHEPPESDVAAPTRTRSMGQIDADETALHSRQER
jgi:hypothetical protein